MANAASVPPLSAEFDKFLFAPIAREENGMMLSVLSALARLDIDPWQAAAQLAKLPPDDAIQKFAAMIGKLPDGRLGHVDSRKMAVRLIALLPREVGVEISRRKPIDGVGVMTNSPAAICAIFCVIFMALMLGGQFFAASHQPPAQGETSHRSASIAAGANIEPPTLTP